MMIIMMKMKMMIMIMTMMNDDAFKECLWPRSSVDHSVNLPQYPTTWAGQWATSHFFLCVLLSWCAVYCEQPLHIEPKVTFMRQLCDSRQKREPGGWIGRSTEWWRYDDDCIIMIICWYHDEYIMNIWWLNVYCWYNDGQTSGTRKRLKGLGHNTNNQVIRIIDNYG